MNIDITDFTAGFISGLAQTFVGHPFDTHKVRLQNDPTHTVKKKNNKFYAGVGYPLASMGIIQSVGFGICENTNKYVDNYYISGAIAGVFSGIVTTPLDYYKTKRQMHHEKIHMKDMFKGLTPTLYREVIALSTFFGVYHSLHDRLKGKLNDNTNALVSGGTSGALSWIVTYPLDVAKTRIQSDESKTIRHALSKGNLKAGLGICILRAIIVDAVAFWSYEKAKQYLS